MTIFQCAQSPRRACSMHREQVFAAFSDPRRLATWWGPNGFTNTFEVFDFRPGGIWRFVMHGPDGTDYPNESVFVDVVRPRRIVFQHVCGPKFEMMLTFADDNGKTRLGWNMLFDTADVCTRVKKYAVPANEENLDRLARHLAAEPDEKDHTGGI